MSDLIRKILQERFISEELYLSEVYKNDIKDLPIGTALHPTSGRGHSAPLVITRKLATKTELTRPHDGAKFHLSHATGTIKNLETGSDSAYKTAQYNTDAEKKEIDDSKSVQHEKDNAVDAIHKHLDGMKNGYGKHVGTLSDSDHTEILQHLEKLREKK